MHAIDTVKHLIVNYDKKNIENSIIFCLLWWAKVIVKIIGPFTFLWDEPFLTAYMTLCHVLPRSPLVLRAFVPLAGQWEHRRRARALGAVFVRSSCTDVWMTP